MDYLISRARRRIGQVLRTLVPRNERYRPTSLYSNSLDRPDGPISGGGRYIEVYPAYTSYLTVPDEFITLAPPYYDRIAEQEEVAPAFVLLLPEGRLNVDNHGSVAVISANNYLVGEASLQFSVGNFALAPAAKNPIFQQRYFRPPVEVAGTVCSLLSGGGAAIGNYYHWLLDSLPRLHLVKEAGLWSEIDYFLIYSRDQRFAVETLLALGIRNEQILDVQSATHLRARLLLVTSPVRGYGRHAPAWVGTFMKEAFLPQWAGVPHPRRFSPFVYISRRDAAFRRVRNEAEVEALLSEYGFESYALTELSFREKAALFAGARAVVGPVGAGLVNILFCAPGTPLIELLPRNLVVPDYLDLTTRLQMPHYPLISSCEAASAQRATADRQDDLTVDLGALRQAVRQALWQPVTT